MNIYEIFISGIVNGIKLKAEELEYKNFNSPNFSKDYEAGRISAFIDSLEVISNLIDQDIIDKMNSFETIDSYSLMKIRPNNFPKDEQFLIFPPAVRDM